MGRSTEISYIYPPKSDFTQKKNYWVELEKLQAGKFQKSLFARYLSLKYEVKAVRIDSIKKKPELFTKASQTLQNVA